MKTKIAFLTILMAFWASVSFASGVASDPADPMEFGRKLLRRIDAVQAQRDTLEAIIGAEGAYRAYRGKTVQEVIDKFTNERGEPEASFFKALNSCVEMGIGQPKEIMTMSALLEEKKANLAALERFLESTGVDVSALRKESELPKVTAAAVALSTLPSKEEVYRADFNLRPDFGKYLPYYLTYDDLGAFFEAQAPLPVKYGAEFIENYPRFPAIFGAGGREYKRDSRYIWRNFMEIVMKRFHGGGDPSDGPFNPYAERLKYNDVWDINSRVAGGTHNKRTEDAYRHFNSSGVEKAGVRLRRGLRL